MVSWLRTASPSPISAMKASMMRVRASSFRVSRVLREGDARVTTPSLVSGTKSVKYVLTQKVPHSIPHPFFGGFDAVSHVHRCRRSAACRIRHRRTLALIGPTVPAGDRGELDGFGRGRTG